jgi:hypothetical protein
MPTLFKIQQPHSHNQLQSDPYLYDTFLETTLSTASPVITLPLKSRRTLSTYTLRSALKQRQRVAKLFWEMLMYKTWVKGLYISHGSWHIRPVVVLYTESSFRFLQLSPTAPLELLTAASNPKRGPAQYSSNMHSNYNNLLGPVTINFSIRVPKCSSASNTDLVITPLGHQYVMPQILI